MDTLMTLIFTTVSALEDAPVMGAHPREAFGASWKNVRRTLNQEMHGRFGCTLGKAPTMSLFVSEVAQVLDHAHGVSAALGFDVAIAVRKITRMAHDLEIAQEPIAWVTAGVRDSATPQESVKMTTEEVSHEPVLNAQAARVQAGEVARRADGTLVPMWVNEVLALA